MPRVLLGALATLLAAGASGLEPAVAPDHAVAARRVVSLNPSLTSILLALGARDTLVGVDDFSARQQPQVADLPAVGGLFNPSLEAVVALEPDLVALVPSVEQRDFRRRLEALGIRVSVFANIRFDEVLENIERLGTLVGREDEAAARLGAIRRTRDAARRGITGRRHPRVVLVLQREPLFVVGGGSFLDEMLGWAGGVNLGAEFAEPYPRVAAEWLVAAAPDVLLDLSPEGQAGVDYWSRWPSLPAVAGGRVLALDPERVTLPGPWVDRGLVTLLAAMHGREVADAVTAMAAAPPPEAAR